MIDWQLQGLWECSNCRPACKQHGDVHRQSSLQRRQRHYYCGTARWPAWHT